MPNIKPYIYAVFANDVYNAVPGVLPDGWRAGMDFTPPPEPSPYPILYADDNSVTPISPSDYLSYFGRVYVNDALRQYVLAHRGTVPTIPADLVSDIYLFRTGEPPVYQILTLPFVKHVQETMVGYQFVGTTGHSLGAALATLTWNSLKANGTVIEATVFELPVPKDIHDFRGVNIYNAAPNAINSIASSNGITVNRLYPSVPIFAVFNIPPSGILGDFGIFTLQQHSMSNLLAQFNASTGDPKIFSVESPWPGTITYTGYSNFISNAQNPYTLLNTLFGNYERYGAGLDYSQYERISIDGSLSPAGVPTSGKTIVGDDTGNDFWGGTDYADTYQGGRGDDTYRLFGGDDTVTDTGGKNTYIFYTPISGRKTLNDANPTAATIKSADNTPISGNAYKITKIASPLPAHRRLEHHPHLRGADNEAELDAVRWNPDEAAPRRAQSTGDLGYAIPSPSAGKAFLAKQGTDGSFNIGDTLDNIADGNALSIPGFRSGDFGIQLPSSSNVTFGSASVHTVGGFPPVPQIYFLTSQGVAPNSNILLALGSSKGLSGFSVYNNGDSSPFSISPVIVGSTVLSGFYMTGLQNGIILVFTAEVKNSVEHDYLRVFDNQGNAICSLPILSHGGAYTLTSSSGNFIFASTDITVPAPTIHNNGSPYLNDDTAPIYLYTMSSTDCSIISKQLLTGYPSSAKAPIMLKTNGNTTALITTEWTTSGSGYSYYGKAYFFDQNLDLISQLQLSQLSSLGYIGSDMSSSGKLVVYSSGLRFINTYLSLYDSFGLIKQISFSGTSSVSYQIIQQPLWINDNRFINLAPKYTAGSSTFSLELSLYDDSGNFIQTLMTTGQIPLGNFSSALTTSIARPSADSSSGTIFASWAETSSGSSDTPAILKTAVVPFGTNAPDVIVGSRQASDIDCSKSQALLCYAVAQEGDGDILTAFIGQNAILIGSDYGAKTFTLLPPFARRLSSEEARELQSSTGVIELWNVKPSDAFNFSALGISGATVATNGHYDNGTFVPDSSSLHIPGYPPINILHSSNSAPFNLTISADGRVVPLPIYVPVQNETNASTPTSAPLGSLSHTSSVPLGSLSQSHSSTGVWSTLPSASSAPFSMSPSPSNILLPAAQTAENSGLSTAGFALGTAAIAGISAGGFVVAAAVGVIGYFVYRSWGASSSSKSVAPSDQDSTTQVQAIHHPNDYVTYINPMSPNNDSTQQDVDLGGQAETPIGGFH